MQGEIKTPKAMDIRNIQKAKVALEGGRKSPQSWRIHERVKELLAAPIDDNERSDRRARISDMREAAKKLPPAAIATIKREARELNMGAEIAPSGWANQDILDLCREPGGPQTLLR